MCAADADNMAGIDKICFAVPWSAQAFYDEAENELAIYFVARDGERLVGYAGFWNVSGEGGITNVAVLPEYRRRGIAASLIGAMIREGKALSLDLLTLEVRRSNTAAQELYKKFGFEVIGERKQYYSDNREDALIMTLKLTDNG